MKTPRPSTASASLPIWFATNQEWSELRASLPSVGVRFALAAGFAARPGQLALLPDATGALAGAVYGRDPHDPMAMGKLATLLPAGRYRFANSTPEPELAALAVRLGLYRFDRFKTNSAAQPSFVAPDGVDAARLERIVGAINMGRDLINRPANDLGPEALEQAVVELAKEFGAKIKITRGKALLKANLPLIHAVGRAGSQAPRLVDFIWGPSSAPKITLVGKGVTFDTGGLDIKPASAMEIMKKDMGGAATALALARMIMASGLKIRLRVLIPIVENSIAGNAFRPGDILTSRKGLTVEIGNTDAEGRLILADALALADEEAPELMFDFATLTGAARVALGPDLPPFYTDDEALAGAIAAQAKAVADPLWRLPFWRPYEAMIEAKIADLTNSPGSAFAGSITAALFLRRFVAKARAYAHFDIYAWNPKPRAYGPEGGEVQGARALFALLEKNYGAARINAARRTRR